MDDMKKYIYEHKALIQFKKAIIKRIHDPKESDQYNFGRASLSSKSKQNLFDIIDNGDHVHYNSDRIWGGLHVIRGSLWFLILSEHFHKTESIKKYEDRVYSGNGNLYDWHVKPGDKPLTLKALLPRIDKLVDNINKLDLAPLKNI